LEAGVTIEGKVQDFITDPEEYPKPVILVFPPFGIGSDFIGFGGSPLVVRDKVVGILSSAYVDRDNFDKSDRRFLFFTRIQDALELLPPEVLDRIGPSLSPLSEEPRETPSRNSILIITALEEELDYLYDEFPSGWGELKVLQDGLSYRRGNFSDEIDIVATSARSMGLVASAIVTTKAIKEWKPMVAAMIGICAGRKEKGVAIGDIIVANQCFHYQFGSYSNGKIEHELRVENTEPQIVDIVEHLSRRSNSLPGIHQSLSRGFKKPNTLLQCHVGPMASADLVVKDVEKFGEALEADRKTIAIDMESYAFMRAARLANTRWAFVIKSVSDFADASKDDEFREYAKFTSTKFCLQVIQSLVGGWR